MAHVLIVEDEQVLNDAYATILTRQGHDVSTAFNGKEALVKAEQSEPDVILLDLLMPEMDGLEFLESYQLKDKHPEVKVVILSNMGDEEKIKKGMDLGAYKYILKARATPDELSVLVNHLIQKNIEKPEES